MTRIWPVAVLVVFGAVSAALAQYGGGVKTEPAPASTVEAADPFAPASSDCTAPDEPAMAPPKQVCYFAVRDPAADQRVREILTAPLANEGMEFTETPLEEVVNLLRDEYKVEIQMDDAAFDDLGIDSNEPVTCSLRNMRLNGALDLLLKKLDLTYVIEDGVLVITTNEEAETKLVEAVYPIGDLRSKPRPFFGGASASAEAAGYDNIVGILTDLVATDTWNENGGGEASIRPLGRDLIIVTQTQRVHEEIARVLNTIRLARVENPVPPELDVQRGSLGEGNSNPDQSGGGGGFGGQGGAVDGNPNAVEKKGQPFS